MTHMTPIELLTEQERAAYMADDPRLAALLREQIEALSLLNAQESAADSERDAADEALAQAQDDLAEARSTLVQAEERIAELVHLIELHMAEPCDATEEALRKFIDSLKRTAD